MTFLAGKTDITFRSRGLTRSANLFLPDGINPAAVA